MIFTLFPCNLTETALPESPSWQYSFVPDTFTQKLSSYWEQTKTPDAVLSQLKLFQAACVQSLFPSSPRICKLHEGNPNALSSLLAPGIVPAHIQSVWLNEWADFSCWCFSVWLEYTPWSVHFPWLDFTSFFCPFIRILWGPNKGSFPGNLWFSSLRSFLL